MEYSTFRQRFMQAVSLLEKRRPQYTPYYDIEAAMNAAHEVELPVRYFDFDNPRPDVALQLLGAMNQPFGLRDDFCRLAYRMSVCRPKRIWYSIVAVFSLFGFMAQEVLKPECEAEE